MTSNGKKSMKDKLIEQLFAYIFTNNYLLFGGTVRDYVIPAKGKKVYPTDIDIGVDNVKSAIDHIQKNLNFCFDIETDIINGKASEIIHAKVTLTYKFSTKPIKFYIDMSNKKVVGSNLDFDVNGIYMSDIRTYKLVESLNPYSFTELIDKINKKKFNILKTYKPPAGSRTQLGIVESSKKLVEYIKMMERTAKMLHRGWKLEKQTKEEIFEPCLIHVMVEADEEKACGICGEEFDKYSLQFNCCKKLSCFGCALNHVKSRFNNTEIPCPYCRGDPFGWNTIKKSRIIQPVNQDDQTGEWSDNNGGEFDDYDNDIPPLVDSDNEDETDVIINLPVPIQQIGRMVTRTRTRGTRSANTENQGENID